MVIYVGAAAMYFVGKRLKKKHNLKENVRLSFYDECNKWVKNLDGNTFAGGDRPNLADLVGTGARILPSSRKIVETVTFRVIACPGCRTR